MGIYWLSPEVLAIPQRFTNNGHKQMCSCDDNPPLIFNMSVRRARKIYTCSECNRSISVNESYENHTGKWDGEWFTYRWCHHCSAGLKVCKVIDPDLCYCYGELWSGIEDSSSGWGRKRHPIIVRMIVAARRHWAYQRGPHGGKLVPVPSVAAVNTMISERRRKAVLSSE